MKIFNYKFIIFLGLTLVVYFIYKEVEHLHKSVNKLEKDINLLSIQQLRQTQQTQQQKPQQIHQTKPQQTHQTKPQQTHQTKPQQTQQPEPGQTQQPEPGQTQQPEPQQTQQPEPGQTQKIINIDLLPSKIFRNQIIACDKQSISDTLENDIDTDSSIHLAIYSNDNDQYDEDHNSLLDNESYDHKFNYNEQIIILKNDTQNILSTTLKISELSESSELSKSHETHELPGLNELLNDLPNELLNSSESSESSELNDLSNKLHNELLNSSESSELNDLPNELHNESLKSSESLKLNDLSNSVKTSEIKVSYTKKSLESLKVPEIKIIAENNNVGLTKQINGNIKNKTKHELIEDIINAQK